MQRSHSYAGPTETFLPFAVVEQGKLGRKAVTRLLLWICGRR